MKLVPFLLEPECLQFAVGVLNLLLPLQGLGKGTRLGLSQTTKGFNKHILPSQQRSPCTAGELSVGCGVGLCPNAALPFPTKGWGGSSKSQFLCP